MNISDIIKLNPKFHTKGKGKSISYGLSKKSISYIDKNVNPKHNTLETGAGLSTVLFAIKCTNHTCIVPDKAQVQKIKQFCFDYDISINKIKFIIDRSENYLPLQKLSKLDFILIDGRHAFPTPFIDWYYSAQKLNIGGLLMIDDTQILTGKILKKFLALEPEWKLIKNFQPRTVVFKKIKDGSHDKWWGQQKYLLKLRLFYRNL